MAKWVVDRSKRSESPIVNTAVSRIKLSLSSLEKLPTEYHWLYSSTESFNSKIDEIKLSENHSAIDFNRVIWTDYARNWDAYSIMSYWRGVELILPTIRSLNLNELVPSAVLARSLLEISATFLSNSHAFYQIVDGLPDLYVDVAQSLELELLTSRAIWGSRLVDKRIHSKQKAY